MEILIKMLLTEFIVYATVYLLVQIQGEYEDNFYCNIIIYIGGLSLFSIVVTVITIIWI